MIDQSRLVIEHKNKAMIVFATILSLSYLYGVLSPQHYAPSVLDLYIGLGLTLALSVGLLIVITQIKITHISHTTIVCLFFAVLVALQSLLSPIDYGDSLLFPVAVLLMMASLSLVIANIQDKSLIIKAIVASVYIGGMLTVCTQLLQLLSLSYPAWLESLIFYGTDSSRPYGNVGQPNQAAYIISMALVTAGYWYLSFKSQFQTYSKLLVVMLACSIVFFGIGQGLSSSRGGLVLCIVACFSMVVLYQTCLKQKLLFSGFFLALWAAGNWIGTALLLRYADFHQSAIDRVIAIDSSRPLRWYLQEQAWLTFSTDWLTGAGWGNLPKVAWAHAEDLKRFEFATHTHFLPSHIAAELGMIGIVGLLGLGFVIIKGFIRSDHNIETKTLAVLITLSLLYACSEYPFWYLRFLLLFTCLVALIDQKKLKFQFNIKPFLMAYFVVLAVGSGFYIKNYRPYVAVDSLIKRDDVEAYEAQILVEQLNPIYGFSRFKDVMMFKVVSVNSNNIQSVIALGNIVIPNYLDPNLMNKQAKLLALNSQSKESLRFYKAACLYNFLKYCNEVEHELHLLSNSQPAVFASIYNDFKKWRTNREK